MRACRQAPPPGAHSACPDRCGNVNAAGWGWFIDPTAGDDSEFTIPGNQGEQHRLDLLTVLEHELGHLLGYDHTDSGLMADTLAAGIRETPTAVLDQVFAVI